MLKFLSYSDHQGISQRCHLASIWTAMINMRWPYDCLIIIFRTAMPRKMVIILKQGLQPQCCYVFPYQNRLIIENSNICLPFWQIKHYVALRKLGKCRDTSRFTALNVNARYLLYISMCSSINKHINERTIRDCVLAKISKMMINLRIMMTTVIIKKILKSYLISDICWGTSFYFFTLFLRVSSSPGILAVNIDKEG